MGRLRVTVIDKATNRPVAARVSLSAADGRSYAPTDSWFHADWLMFDQMDKSEYHYFHTTDGKFEVELPPGITRIAFSKGLEYLPVEKELTVSANQVASLTVNLERLDNLPSKGWWGGDNHFHMNYAGVYRENPELLMKQADAEDISVMNNLICNKEQRIPDVGYFTGAPDAISNAERVLYHNEEYHPPFWGHAVFLNLKKHLIIPAYVGYQDTIVSSIYPPNTVPFRIVREDGGYSGYAHGAGKGFAADLALDNVDFVEANAMSAMEPLYRAWNCGYHVVASAGEDAFPNFYRSYIIGTNRVYVNAGKKLDYDTWIRNFRAGRSFVTSGPLVFFTLDNKQPGDEIKLPAAAGRELRAAIEVESITPIESVELLYNNTVVDREQPADHPLRFRFSKAVMPNRSGWYAVRVKAAYGRHPIRTLSPFAATMPIWVSVGDQPVRSAEDADYFINWIDKTLQDALALPAWNNELEKSRTRQLYGEARAAMVRRREEAH